MEVDDIRRIADYRIAVETATLMLEDLESTYSCAMRGFGNKVSATLAPDSRLIDISDRCEQLRAQLKQNCLRYEDAMQTCLDKIEKIDDFKLRKILFLRYAKNVRWAKIADELGTPYTSDSVKKSAERYFQRCREESLRTRPN